MKKHLLALSIGALAFTFNTAKAQLISSSADDFEVWSADPLNSAAMDPNGGTGQIGWQCLNILSGSFAGSSPVSVFQENSTVKSGAHSCKITSVVLTSTSYSYVKSFIPHDTVGIVVGGEISLPLTIKLGVPFTKRLASYQMKFWYQYTPAMNGSIPDTGFCSIVLSHFSGGKRNILGAGKVMLNSATSWTLDSVPMVYDSLSGNPDTALVFFSSSSFYKPVPGSALYIDAESVVAGVGEVHSTSASVNVYPNPAKSEVNFSITCNDMASRADIYDITGQKVNSYEVKNNMASFNTTSYAPGLYFYQLYDKAGTMMKIGKFSVTR
jgi:hypothetical protein